MGHGELDEAEIVDHLMVLFDSAAKVSPGLWRRMSPPYEGLLKAVISHCSDECLRQELEALATGAHGIHRYMLEKAVAATGASTRLCGALEHVREACWVLPYRVPGPPPHPTKPIAEKPIADQISDLHTRLAARPVRDAAVDLAFVINFRAVPAAPERLRNLLACLAGLDAQTVSRDRLRVVLVEQDAFPRHRELLADLVDTYLFADNAGTYNYAWGRNVGVRHGVREPQVCLLDADIVVPTDFAARVVEAFDRDVPGLVPHDSMVFLDSASSGAVVSALTDGAWNAGNLPSLSGYQLTEVYGGSMATTTEFYRRIGGQDERYEGWGDEDNEFYYHLRDHAPLRRLVGPIFHLDHPRPQTDADGKRINAGLLGQARYGDAEIGDLDRYRGAGR